MFGVNEVLEGRGEKIQKDIENRKGEINPNSPEYMEQMSKVFAQIQAPMQDQKELKESLAKYEEKLRYEMKGYRGVVHESAASEIKHDKVMVLRAMVNSLEDEIKQIEKELGL